MGMVQFWVAASSAAPSLSLPKAWGWQNSGIMVGRGAEGERRGGKSPAHRIFIMPNRYLQSKRLLPHFSIKINTNHSYNYNDNQSPVGSNR